jgi:hypothetical protein
VHGEVIDAARLLALIVMVEERRGLATYRRLGPDAELVTLDAIRLASELEPPLSRHLQRSFELTVASAFG